MVDINITIIFLLISNVMMLINHLRDIKKINNLENTIAFMDGTRDSTHSFYDSKIEYLMKTNNELLEEIQILKGEK